MEASRGVGALGAATSGTGFRLGAMALAVGMALGLSACGGGGGGNGNVRPTSPSTVPPSSPPSVPTTSVPPTSSPPDQPPTSPPTNGTGFAGGAIDVATGVATVLADKLSGSFDVVKEGAGALTLTGTNAYTGVTQVTSGELYVDGDQSASTGNTEVASGATLGGRGTIGGNVTVDAGATLAPGSRGAVGNLLIHGNLALSSSSVLAYDATAFDAHNPWVSDFLEVKGDLTLDGRLKIDSSSGGFPGPGVYRLLNYGGSLIDNGLDVDGGLRVQTAVAHQINVVDAQGMNVTFWDGDGGPQGDRAVNGGNGTWQASGTGARTNWTDVNGATNSVFANGSFAVFQATPGTVTVDAGKGDVTVAGMQFASTGYLVQGDPIGLVGGAGHPELTVFRVGDGTAAGVGYAATIKSVLTGSSGLVKTDLGTLVLGGANTYTGGTTIDGGVLQIGSGGTSGSIIGDVTDNGTLAFNRSDLVEFAGVIQGSGALRKAGAGTLILTGDHTYTGGTTVIDGILQIGKGGTVGWLTGDIVNNSYVRFDRSDDVLFGSNITGSGALLKDGAGTLIVTGNLTEDGTNTANKPTTVTEGTLQIGNGGTIGTVAGDVTDNAALVFNRSDTVRVDGAIRGTGALTQAGTGTLIVANDVSLAGITISRGTLQIGNGGAKNWNSGPIANNGTLVLNLGNPSYVAPGITATISGSGNLIKEGADAVALVADNTYTGGTRINGGTLQLGTGGTTGGVTGDIFNDGLLVIDRSDNVTLSNRVSGAGVFQKTGSNTLTITGDLTHTGGTTINQGSLQIGDGGTTGTLAGPILDNASLVFNRNDDQVFAGAISGSGQVTKLGVNTVTLSGANTFTGGTFVTAGTLRVAGGSSLGYQATVGGNQVPAVLRVDAGARIADTLLQDGATLDNAGTVHGGGPFTAVRGGAAAVINRDGGIIETVLQRGYVGGAVSLGANSTLTNGSGSIIRGSRGVESAGVVNNDGGTISGLTNAGIYGDMPAVNNTNGGRITSGSEAPPFNLPISSGVFASHTNVVINNLGASSIVGVQNGISLRDGGAVNNDRGSLVAGMTGVAGDSMSSAIVAVNNTSGGNITGSQTGIRLGVGGVVVNGAGSTIGTTAASSGDCSATPACAIYVPVYSGFGQYGSNGSLTLSNAGYIVGDVQMDPALVHHVTLSAGGYIHGALKIGGNSQSTLALDGDAGTTQRYSDAVTGSTTFSGAVLKNGTGTWLIDGNALPGVASTAINAGSLRATQALAGSVTVNTSGSLDGVPGVLGGLVNNGRVLVHAGDSTVGGGYSQTSGGILAVSLGSKLAVSGAATLGGTLEVTGADAGYVSNTHTDVLVASGGVSGTFSQLVKDAGVVFTSTTIQYDAQSAWLDTTGLNVTTAVTQRGGVLTTASMASATRVQKAFNQMDANVASGTLSDVPATFVTAAGQFQQAPTVQAAQASLQTLSGQLHAASAAMTFEAIDASSRALADHLDDLLDRKSGYGMWTHDLSMDGNMGRSGFDSVGFQLNGWMIGNDRKIGNSGVAGFAFGQSQGQQRLDQSADRNRSRTTEGMLYAGTLNGNWYTQARLGVGHFEQDVNRQLLLGLDTQAVGTRYGGDYSVAYGETGLNLNLAGTRVIPFINVEYANIRRDGFTEQGAGGFGLQAHAQVLDRWQAGAGFRASRHWDFGGGRGLDVRASAQFQRTLASTGDVFDASFVGLQQWQPLVGIGLSRYSGLFNVGLKANLATDTSLDLGYDYQMGQRDSSRLVSARFVKTF